SGCSAASCTIPQGVAHASHGVDQGLLFGAFDLLAEERDVNIDGVGQGSGAFLPDVACDHVAGDRRVLVAKQELEELELASGQLDLDASSGDRPGDQVHFQVVGLEAEITIHNVTPQQCANPGEQLGEGKRFGQVIVGPRIEPLNSVLDPVSRREDQDRLGESVTSQAAQHVQSIAFGKHQVKHDGIDGPTLGVKIPLLSGQGRDHLVALLGQTALQTLQKLLLVLDHKQARHG